MTIEAIVAIVGIAGTVIAALLTWIGIVMQLRYKKEQDARERHDEFEQKSEANAEAFMRQVLAQCERQSESIKVKDRTISNLQKQLNELQVKINRLNEEVEELKKTKAHDDANQMLEILCNSIPYCLAIHEIGSNLWYINDYYAETFHVPRKNFWTPVNLIRYFDAKKAARFVEIDQQVAESQVKQQFDEKLPLRILEPESEANPCVEWTAVKTPIIAGAREYVLTFKFPKNQEPSITI